MRIFLWRVSKETVYGRIFSKGNNYVLHREKSTIIVKVREQNCQTRKLGAYNRMSS